MEKLIIKNFGPIKNATIQIAKFTLLIGHTATGKSTVAKLLCIFNSEKFYYLETSSDIAEFMSLLEEYSILYEFTENTFIEYSNDYYTWTITAKGINTDYNYGTAFKSLSLIPMVTVKNISRIVDLASENEEINNYIQASGFGTEQPSQYMVEEKNKFPWRDVIEGVCNILFKGSRATYIPAERNLFAIMKKNIFSIANSGLSIPKSLIAFGAYYEQAKAVQGNTFRIPFLKARIHFNEEIGEDMLLEKGSEIPLSNASSGYQSLVPLYTVMEFFCNLNHRLQGKTKFPLLVIEEPELNLFPSVQKELIQEIVKGINYTNCKTIIASHSPYVLSVIDTLVQAGNVAKDKQKVERVKEVFKEEYWIDFDDVECYYFNQRGMVKSVKNNKLKIIGANVLDEISEDLNSKYDQLLDIKYNE